mmetsp:Transcript_30687/g.73627  ORF Transcript_30687/g.73627 Transcript_30687/m.73627 type:complete len:262 (-) Transcript_30687:266-1051(-)
MERFSVAITTQLEVEASAQRAWKRLHEFENLHNVFSTVYSAESVGSPWEVGSKIKVSRLLPTGHCFMTTFIIVEHDEENMEFRFYSEDIVSPGAATVSTTWKVEALEKNRCLVTMSFAIVPRKFICSAGRIVFAPFLKRIVKRTIKQDLKDLAASFDKENDMEEALLQHSNASSRLPIRLAHARKFEEPKAEENKNSERTRSTTASYDDAVPGALSSGHSSYASRVTPLGRLGYPEEQESRYTNIREVQSDGRLLWKQHSP